MRTTPCLLLIAFLLLSACTPTTDEPAAQAAEAPFVADHYALGVELTPNGLNAVTVGLAPKPDGGYRFGGVTPLAAPRTDVPLTADGRLDTTERTLLLDQLTDLIAEARKTTASLRSVHLVLNLSYTDVPGADDLLRSARAAHPDLTTHQLTPATSALANMLTMRDRIAPTLDEFTLVEIGGRGTVIAAFDRLTDSLPVATEVPLGTRNTLATIDPLLEFSVERENQRDKMIVAVDLLAELPLKKAMRQPAMASKEKIVLVGGLVYKIIKVLDLPLTGGLIDFSRRARGKPVYVFRELIARRDPALAAGPNYSAEELYSSLRLLEIITNEVGDDEAVFFFERPTWLPGYVVMMEEEGRWQKTDGR